LRQWAVGVTRVRADPDHAVPNFDRRRGNVVGPEVKGAATSEVKTRLVPMAGQDSVFDRAAVERKSKMGAAVVEGKHPPIIIDDEQRTASAANDQHACGLKLLQRRHANEASGMGG
jgi:hypothetical protein